jgi:hypothetical protein
MTDPDEQTGTGAPRSGAQIPSLPEQAADYEEGDDAVPTGATTGSNPAGADEVDPNRSGSGGTGGPADGTDER